MPKAAAMAFRTPVLLRALAVWLVLPVIAVLNGALREAALVLILGRAAAEVASVAILLAAVYAVVFLFLVRQPPLDRVVLWTIGVCWGVLTVAFEVVFFGLAMGVPLEELLAAYNIAEGELWPLVVLGVVLAPPAVGALIRRRGTGRHLPMRR
jgi:hypothetical protein